MKPANLKQKISFLMLMGTSLHRYGASSDRVEKALVLTANILGISGDFFSTPTGIFACFKVNNQIEETRLKRLDVGKVNLSKLLLVDQVVDDVLDQKIGVHKGSARIQKIINYNPLYGSHLVNISYVLIAFCISLYLGGNIYDALISGFFSFFVGFFANTVKLERVSSIYEAIASFVVTFLSIYICSNFDMTLHPQIISLSAIITLIPGLMLTMAVGELASNNLTSGTARLLGSIMILLKITFGVYLAHIFTSKLGLTITEPRTNELSIIQYIFALLLSALGFMINFQARKQEYLWIALGCILTFFCSLYMNHISTNAIAAFTSGSFIAAFSNIFSRVTKKPALTILLPSLILLVPGSVGFKGIEFMFNENPIEGINELSKMIIVAVALVSGTFFGSILINPKRTL
ncbi:MAG: threonine/serine exporter family protein [Bacteriovoracaceae bacterium]|jgi:uncharacterized membrane protein YjjP (DUF1212 family)|nr:threonine/serine exporter family protein [Bacteriovoracaceae bacterium]